MVDESADRLAALRQHPEVAKALRNVLDVYTSACANAFYTIETDALLSAVAAAATAQTLDAMDAKLTTQRQRYWVERAPIAAVVAIADARLAVNELRALAGGAPPATQTTDTTEDRDMGMPGEKHLLSGDGRAGATAPTPTDRGFAYQRESVISRLAAYYRCGDDVSERACLEAAEEDVATLLRVHLAAWIDGLTPDQLSDLAHAQTRNAVRSALTRLGGAHE